ncbi:CAP domain-containing protein [Ralstonia soli]|uniref:CAP domain-containing protein n=1 Tax=Ralstonia soli TaxID=2953896 RepID=A0ABT1AEW4_9RALS|nr:CAP domain-containing protein [Ralstonia soli]MCO5396662.1 CAP domain-containing protein [Ralstonia soli]
MVKKIALLAVAVTSALHLSGCGGDDGASNSTAGSTSGGTTTPPTQSIPGTVTTLQYQTGSAELAAFAMLNQYRSQCGFPMLQENTVLDRAAQAHATYEGLNSIITDTEVPGHLGFTGITGADTAATFGWPSGVYTGRGDAGYYSASIVTASQFGQKFVAAWASGVYHIAIVTSLANLIGLGEYETNYNSYPVGSGTVQLGQAATYTLSNAPLTFPCQGVSGIAYQGRGETPTPPNTSGSWGSPVSVTGNLNDTVTLTSAIYTGPLGNAIPVQILNASTDPNKLLAKYQAVAYPTQPLQPNTQYSVVLNGTVNGTVFSRNFTFTTGS